MQGLVTSYQQFSSIMSCLYCLYAVVAGLLVAGHQWMILIYSKVMAINFLCRHCLPRHKKLTLVLLLVLILLETSYVSVKRKEVSQCSRCPLNQLLH